MQEQFDTKKHGIWVCACVCARDWENFIILFVSVLKNEE